MAGISRRDRNKGRPRDSVKTRASTKDRAGGSMERDLGETRDRERDSSLDRNKRKNRTRTLIGNKDIAW